ncbi:MAG: carbohydrate porin [Candidatus Omnitrophota bacterium]
MRKLLVFIFAAIFIFSTAIAFAGGPDTSNEELLREIRALKARILELETRLMKQEQRLDKAEDAVIEEYPLASITEGLSIGAGATFVIQGTDEINEDSVTSGDAVTDMTYSVDLEIEKKFEDYGKALIHLETGDGAGVEDELTVFSNVNRDADDSDNSVSVTEVWYEHYPQNLLLTVTAGKIDPTGYIDTNEYANDECSQFLGRIFRNSPVIEFPDNSVGGRIAIEPTDFMDVELLAMDADSDWENIFSSTFIAGQINLKPNLLGRPGNYRVLGWIDDRDHTKWNDSTQKEEEGLGFGISFDQEFTDNIGAFVRYGWQDPKQRLNGLTNDFSLEHSWSTGLQISGAIWGRDDDVFALAVGQATPSPDYEDAGTNLEAKDEGHFEAYYSYKVNDHLTLSPDIQIIWNPYGCDAAIGDDTISVYGMRAQVGF